MSFTDQTIQIVDEQGELGKLNNVENKARQVDGTLARLDTHSSMTWRQATHIFTSGYRMLETILKQFGVAVPPVISAIISGLPPIVSAITALGAAETALGHWAAGIAVGLAVASVVSGILAATQAGEATKRAIQEGQRTTTAILGFANSWRSLY
jgi:hypothetical protein